MRDVRNDSTPTFDEAVRGRSARRGIGEVSACHRTPRYRTPAFALFGCAERGAAPGILPTGQDLAAVKSADSAARWRWTQ